MEQEKLKTIVTDLLALRPILFKRLFSRPSFKSIISPANQIMIGMLYRHGELKMSEIGDKLGIPKPNVTALADKLIKEGLAERIPDPNDRRVIYIKLTPNGLHQREEFQKNEIENLSTKLSSLSTIDINDLADALHKVREILNKIPSDNTCCTKHNNKIINE